jgi:hypothetical protein
MLDADKDTVESDLLMSYLRYKGNDISALAKNIATTNSVQSLRERMQKNRRNASSDKGIKPKTQELHPLSWRFKFALKKPFI